jgi:lipoyl(octanoyl) transferase
VNKKVKFKDLGLIDYKKCWDYQESLFADILAVKSANRNKKNPDLTLNYLLFCEHQHVYTLGKSGNKKNLLVGEKYLKSKGASFYKINRGGDITYHGPGQIVGYPILDLDNFFTDIHKYLRLLEESIILTLSEYGLKAQRSSGETGVWFDVGTERARKICAFGVKSSRWVTMHGFALNVNSDLSYFSNIIPCGIANKKVTSLEAEIGEKLNIDEVKNKIKKYLTVLFDMEVV